MEKIYTIPVNEAFSKSAEDKSCGCAMCSLERMLEANELDIILGAAMMEPDIRIKTNKSGFCARHFDMMFEMKNRLGLALMLESHLDEWREKLKPSGLKGLTATPDKRAAMMGELSSGSYVCDRARFHFEKMNETAVILWDTEKEFRDKFAAQPYICLDHYKKLVEYAKKRLSKKRFSEFGEAIDTLTFAYYDKLREDVKWFIKKFDYRYDEEPWGDAKDAVERAIKFLSRQRDE
ncbi:MAG: hypothetical protein IJE84_02560 [Clostridia bacterium]|nr:hypothetical protein [Clostridia bacterium]